MPLSEREQEILQEIERHLQQEDPRLARSARWRDRTGGLGALTFVVGFGILVLFFVTELWFVGVLAYALMVAGIVLVTNSVRSRMASGGIRERARDAVRGWETRVRRRYDRD